MRPVEPWVLTHSGRAVDLIAPDPQSIHLEDIALSLSRRARWGGHTHTFYSVGEHSCRVAYLVYALAIGAGMLASHAKILARAGLFHDGHEAIVGDTPTPVKVAFGRPAVEAVASRLDVAIAAAFDFDPRLFDDPLVKLADAIMLATEARDLMPRPPRDWLPLEPAPLPGRIIPCTSMQAAEDLFLSHFEALQ